MVRYILKRNEFYFFNSPKRNRFMRLQHSPNIKARNIQKDKFNKLLNWLDKDREIAGFRYEEIRFRLTKVFSSRGCEIPQELADETIDRVTNKIDFLKNNFVGNPILYFYGVAKKVFLEYTRQPINKELPINLTYNKQNTAILEENDLLLTKSLKQLPPNQSKFILDYYKKDKAEKIKHRKKMAKELGITEEALRVRAFRIRKLIQKSLMYQKNKAV